MLVLASMFHLRWRLYSLAEGDTLRTWRVEPFVLVKGGCRWVPPPMTAVQVSSGQSISKWDETGVPLSAVFALECLDKI